MGEAFVSSATVGAVAAAVTRFSPLNGLNGLNSVEQRVQAKFYSSITFSNLNFYISSNATTASSSITLRKNSANTSITASIPAATTGYFSDTTNTDTSASGDLYNFSLVNGGGGNFSATNISIELNPASNTITKFISTADVNFATASVTYFMPLNGVFTPGATEADVQTKIRTAGTQKNLFIFVRTNARTTTSTVRNRINGADGAMSVSIPASTNGTFEDITNSNSIADSDLLNYSLTTGTGTGNLNITICTTELETTNSKFAVGGGVAAGTSLTGVTRFFCPGALTAFSVEAQASTVCPFACTLRNLGVYVGSNAASGSSTVDVRVNSVSSAISISIGAGLTGIFEDASNSASVSANNTVSIRIVSGTGGAIIWDLSSLIGETSAPTGGQRVQAFIL